MPKLTKRIVEGAEPGNRQIFIWDSELRGFGLRILPSGKRSYVVQGRVNGRSRRVTIGQHGRWTVDEARKEARGLLARMDKGEDPNAAKQAAKARGITFQQALDLHLAAKTRSPETVAWYKRLADDYLAGWKRRPLIEITRKMARARHRAISRRHGRYAANGAMRVFRAAWNRALKQHPELPICPTINVDWNEEAPRKTAVKADGLAQLYADIEATKNPIRRDYYLFVLFTGMRREAAVSVRWEDIDWQRRTLFVPKPKGGERRAFHLPLSRYVAAVLRRRRMLQRRDEAFADSPWVFPAHSRSGHISEPKELEPPARGRKGEPRPKRKRRLPSPHALRHTFSTAAHACRVSEYDIKLLMNHALPKNDVTAGYIEEEIEALRHAAQAVADYLRRHAKPRREPRGGATIIELPIARRA